MSQERNLIDVIEKRKFLRLEDYFTVSFRPASEFGGTEAVAESTVGYSKNLSLGGIAFVSEGEVAVGDVIAASIQIPEFDGPVEVIGEVIRCRPFGEDRFEIAIKFLPFGMDEDQRSRLELFIYDQFLVDPGS